MEPSYESVYQEVNKAQFDWITSLLQTPNIGTFTHTDLTWTSHMRMKGMRADPRTADTVSVAYIPWVRVQDFVEGEEARSDAPCKFVCQGTPTNGKGKLKFPRWNSYSAILRCVRNMQLASAFCMFQYYNILRRFFPVIYDAHRNHLLSSPSHRYHCQYGPKDNASHIPVVTNDMYQQKRKLDMKGKFIPNGKGHTGPRTSARMRGSGQRRGCQCGFVVKRLYLQPEVAEITYHQMKHVNLQGFFCHGATKTGHKSRYSSNLSADVREFIMTHLRLGLSIPQIMVKHRKRFMEVCERGEALTRDLFISEQDIRNVAGRLAVETYKRDNNDAKSVRMWVQENPFEVFYYKESGVHVRGAITRDNIPFTIGIQTSWQQDMMLKHGHKKAVSIDATFATNENKVCAGNHSHNCMLRTNLPECLAVSIIFKGRCCCSFHCTP